MILYRLVKCHTEVSLYMTSLFGIENEMALSYLIFACMPYYTCDAVNG